MATTNESSVLVNLKELFTMEADRRVEAAAAGERAKAEEAARVEARRREREAELEEARADERRRAEEERAGRDAKLEARLRTLRDELAQVRAQREEMQLRVAEIAARPAGAARHGGWTVGLMAAASLVAAITATAVAWPRPEQRVAHAEAPAAVELGSPIEEARADVAPEPTVEERPTEPTAVTVAVSEPSRGPRHVRQQRERQRERTLTEQLNLGEGDEVLSDAFLNGAGN